MNERNSEIIRKPNEVLPGPFKEKYDLRDSLEIHIDQPPNSHLEVCIVVPVRMELHNESILHSLASLAEQTVSKEQFEIIYVVNNQLQDVTEQNEIFKDNQTLLHILKYINGLEAELPSTLLRHHKKIIERAKLQGVQVRIIDYSTNGFPTAEDMIDPSKKKGIGFARYAGIVAAKNRLDQVARDANKDKMIICHLDADTMVSLNYVQKRKDFFKKNPNLNTEFLNIDFTTLRGDKEHFQKTFAYQLEHHCKRLSTSVFSGADSVGGSQITSRANAYDKIDPTTFLQKRDGEDLAIATGLFSQHQYQFSSDITVHFEDRKAAVSDFNGLSTHRLEWGSDTEMLEDKTVILEAMYMYLLEQTDLGENFFTKLSQEIKKVRCYSEVKTSWIRAIMVNLLKTAYTLDTDIKDFLEDNEELSFSIIHRNPWMIEYIHELKQKSSFEEAMQQLESDFPDYMLPIRSTPARKHVAVAIAMINTLHYVFIHEPEKASAVFHTSAAREKRKEFQRRLNTTFNTNPT